MDGKEAPEGSLLFDCFLNWTELMRSTKSREDGNTGETSTDPDSSRSKE